MRLAAAPTGPLGNAGLLNPTAERGAVGLKPGLFNLPFVSYLAVVSTVQEIEAAIPRLSRAEVETLRAWIDEFLEDQLELSVEVKASLDQSRREIAQGHYTTRQPE